MVLKQWKILDWSLHHFLCGLRSKNAQCPRILSHAVKNLASGKFLKLIIPFCTFFKKCVSFRPGRTGQNILSKTISLGISLEAPEKPSKVVLLTSSNHYGSDYLFYIPHFWPNGPRGEFWWLSDQTIFISTNWQRVQKMFRSIRDSLWVTLSKVVKCPLGNESSMWVSDSETWGLSDRFRPP